VVPTPSGSDHFPSAPVVSGFCNALLGSSSNFRYRNGSWSGGGGLYVHKVKVVHTGWTALPFNPFGADLGTYHVGGVTGVDWSIPDDLLSNSAPFSTVTSGMSNLGVEAYKRMRPGQAKAGAAQFLYELKEFPLLPFQKVFFKKLRPRNFADIPVAAKNAVLDIKNLGSEYLNFVFGWLPLVSDLRKMYRLYKSIDRELARLYRENGKTIHRHVTLNQDTDVTQTESISNAPYLNVSGAPPNFGFVGASRYTVTTRTTVKEWSSACFKYYLIDSVPSSEWTSRSRAQLFGLLPTPETIWEVIPWSWLIDWFSNIGDVISNLSANAADNLAMLYSYTMRHTVTTSVAQCDSWHQASSVPGWWPESSSNYVSRRDDEVKLRIPSGSPFQFGPTLTPLTGYQAGILAALGASRGLVQ